MLYAESDFGYGPLYKQHNGHPQKLTEMSITHGVKSDPVDCPKCINKCRLDYDTK